MCQKDLVRKQTKFCSNRCKAKGVNTYPKQQERAWSRKLALIARLGGKCQKCGYNANMAALQFHHTDPKLKKFNLDARHLGNNCPEKIEAEILKCELLCSNCHFEHHNPHLNLENVPSIKVGATGLEPVISIL